MAIAIAWSIFNLPICHRELGSATEYTLLLVSPGHLSAALRGSCECKAWRILARGTLYPLARNSPAAMDSPTFGSSLRKSYM